MARGKSNATKKQKVSECSGLKENIEILEAPPTVSREEVNEDRILNIEKKESVEKRLFKKAENESKEEASEALLAARLASELESEADEVWDIIRVIPTAEENIECRYEHCSEQAVATWATDKDPEVIWPVCQKCQLEDFGGWPEGVLPIDRSDDSAATSVVSGCTTASNDNTAPIENTMTCTTLSSTDPSRDNSDIVLPMTTAGEPDITHDESDTALPKTTGKPAKTPDDNDPETPEEKYELSSIVSIEKLHLNPIKCSNEACNLPACSVWTSTSDPKKWYYCIDCQESDFGGWPPLKELPCNYLSKEHLLAIATKCSKKRKPMMPVFTAKCVTPNPSLSPKGTAAIPEVVRGDTKPSVLKVSRAAVARHEKWQADAKKLGVNRIIVKKNEAKKVVFDALFDAFRPMSIDNIYLVRNIFLEGSDFGSIVIE